MLATADLATRLARDADEPGVPTAEHGQDPVEPASRPPSDPSTCAPSSCPTASPERASNAPSTTPSASPSTRATPTSRYRPCRDTASTAPTSADEREPIWASRRGRGILDLSPNCGPAGHDVLATAESPRAGTASLFGDDAELAPHEKKIFALLKADESTHIDELVERLEGEVSLSEIFAALFELELAGKVRQMPGKNFVKVF